MTFFHRHVQAGIYSVCVIEEVKEVVWGKTRYTDLTWHDKLVYVCNIAMNGPISMSSTSLESSKSWLYTHFKHISEILLFQSHMCQRQNNILQHSLDLRMFWLCLVLHVFAWAVELMLHFMWHDNWIWALRYMRMSLYIYTYLKLYDIYAESCHLCCFHSLQHLLSTHVVANLHCLYI